MEVVLDRFVFLSLTLWLDVRRVEMKGSRDSIYLLEMLTSQVNIFACCSGGLFYFSMCNKRTMSGDKLKYH